MNNQGKTKEELIKELQKLRQENNSLRASYDKDITKRKQAEQEVVLLIY
jgi:mannitol/fructose-specific phosphotransferase system IIA component (Ntr-type)